MKKPKLRYALLSASLALALASCGGLQLRREERRPVWEVPPKALEYAQSGGGLARADPWPFRGTIPRAFRDGDGNYRICWIKKDPLRDSYWWEWYEFSSDGTPRRGAAGPIPSRLKEPDPARIPGWQEKAVKQALPTGVDNRGP